VDMKMNKIGIFHRGSGFLLIGLRRLFKMPRRKTPAALFTAGQAGNPEE